MPRVVLSAPLRARPYGPNAAVEEAFFGGQGPRPAPWLGEYGAGIVIRPPDLVLTSARLISGASNIEVVTRAGRRISASAIVVDSRAGLALVKADRDLGVTGPPVAEADGLACGEGLVVVGSPLGMTHSVRLCHVANTDRSLHEAPDILSMQIDSLGAPGYEGGPAFTESGKLVGIALDWPVTPSPNRRLFPSTAVQAASVDQGVTVGFVVPTRGLLQRLLDAAD